MKTACARPGRSGLGEGVPWQLRNASSAGQFRDACCEQIGFGGGRGNGRQGRQEAWRWADGAVRADMVGPASCLRNRLSDRRHFTLEFGLLQTDEQIDVSAQDGHDANKSPT
jgi:hypothetical protein